MNEMRIFTKRVDIFTEDFMGRRELCYQLVSLTSRIEIRVSAWVYVDGDKNGSSQYIRHVLKLFKVTRWRSVICADTNATSTRIHHFNPLSKTVECSCIAQIWFMRLLCAADKFEEARSDNHRSGLSGRWKRAHESCCRSGRQQSKLHGYAVLYQIVRCHYASELRWIKSEHRCRLIDYRDGMKYTVQVVHSASLLLSMIIVYGCEQKLLCMSHLVGADTLPSKDQLDTNLVCLLNVLAYSHFRYYILWKYSKF